MSVANERRVYVCPACKGGLREESGALRCLTCSQARQPTLLRSSNQSLLAGTLLRVVQDLRSAVPILKTSTHVAAVIGALPAAYAMRNFRRETLRPLVFCLAIAGGIGLTMMAGGAIASGNLAHRTLIERLKIGVDSLLLYVPLVFVFEEVSLRGVFDSHLNRPGAAKQWISALWISLPWGLWHVPVTLGVAPLHRMLANVCCVIGVPFSIYWRRSGNLIVTGSTHALIDAVRNALLVLPWR